MAQIEGLPSHARPPVRRSMEASPRPPGVDLNDPRTYSLVRRIYLARFARRVRAAGLDPEDILQDIYLGLVVRNEGKSRWNPERGALSTWIYVACSGIVLNKLEQQRGWIQRNGTVGEAEDVSTWAALTETPDEGDIDLALDLESVRRRLESGERASSIAASTGMAPADARRVATSLDLEPPTPHRKQRRGAGRRRRPWTRRQTEALQTIRIPDRVRSQILRGVDPFIAACQAGWAWLEASTLGMEVRDATGLRLRGR